MRRVVRAMDKTVSELAKELDINKLRIYRYIKKQNIKPIRTHKNVHYFDILTADAISKHFQEDNSKRVSPKKESNINDTSNDTNKHDLIELKDIIISRQDREIKNLYSQIENLQRTIDNQNKQFDQQQQLELESIKSFKKRLIVDNQDTSNNTPGRKKKAKKHVLLGWFKHLND